MSIKDSERFKSTDINVVVANLADFEAFPPSRISYSDKGLKLTILGTSNYQDLIPLSVDKDEEFRNAILRGEYGQFIAVSDEADFYEVLIYRDPVHQVILHSIRTRQMPAKTKKSEE